MHPISQTLTAPLPTPEGFWRAVPRIVTVQLAWYFRVLMATHRFTALSVPSASSMIRIVDQSPSVVAVRLDFGVGVISRLILNGTFARYNVSRF